MLLLAMILATPVAALGRGPTDDGCWVAARVIPAGTPLSRRDVDPAPCLADGVAAPLRLDRANGMLVAHETIAAGTPLGAFAAPPAAAVGAGTVLTLRSANGPVTVERTVTTLQPGRSGGRVFVRDAAGSVFAARLVLADEAAR